MMSYFFPAMLCSPYGEISTLKACRVHSTRFSGGSVSLRSLAASGKQAKRS